jgi:hypothetical protein
LFLPFSPAPVKAKDKNSANFLVTHNGPREIKEGRRRQKVEIIRVKSSEVDSLTRGQSESVVGSMKIVELYRLFNNQKITSMNVIHTIQSSTLSFSFTFRAAIIWQIDWITHSSAD